LKPPDDGLFTEKIHGDAGDVVVIELPVNDPTVIESRFYLSGLERWSEIRAPHQVFLSRRPDAPLSQDVVPDVECNTKRATRIARCWLDPDIVERTLAPKNSVGYAVESHSAGHAEFSFPGLLPQVIRHPEDDCIGHVL
jgi:hypothetical protein